MITVDTIVTPTGTRLAVVRDEHGATESLPHTEAAVRERIEALTRWLDEPRMTARRTPEIVARDSEQWIALVRTPYEWGVATLIVDGNGEPTGTVALALDPPDWFEGKHAEHGARRLYAEERGLLLCLCGAETATNYAHEDDHDPVCRACAGEGLIDREDDAEYKREIEGDNRPAAATSARDWLVDFLLGLGIVALFGLGYGLIRLAGCGR